MKILIGIVIILTIIVILEMIREYHTFQITDYQIVSEKLSGIQKDARIVFLSDLHNRSYGGDNRVLIKKIQEIQPDLILVGGDMLVGKEESPWSAASDFVKELPKICPVYYANGNHEYRMKIYTEKYGDSFLRYRKTLKDSGVHFLENESSNIELYGEKIRISGLEIPRHFYSKFHKHDMKGKDVDALIGNSETDVYQILLAHNPTYCRAYKEWGADLILSGHLHGGVVRIPGIGGVISTQLELFPRYSGEMRKEGHCHIVVSKGLGTHSINLRLFNLPEIVVLHLKCYNRSN